MKQLKKDFEAFMDQHLAPYEKVDSQPYHGNIFLPYKKQLRLIPTISMIIMPPYSFKHGVGLQKELDHFAVFLYDEETDVCFSAHSEVNIDSDWKSRILKIYDDAYERIHKSICPHCGFWLVNRLNKNAQPFMACVQYPECKYTAKIKDVYQGIEGI
jgi:hypothetical protein